MYPILKRLFDILFALSFLILFFPVMLLTALAIRLTSKGPALYWSERIGKNNQNFMMPKFRSMRIDTPALPTHLLKDGQSFLSPIGGFLRKSSLDELPQFISVLKGDMSIVGPRPALFNQDDLKELRTDSQVHTIPPGITGYAQIKGRDELPIPQKVEFDRYYFENKSFFFDLKIICLTIYKVLLRKDISH